MMIFKVFVALASAFLVAFFVTPLVMKLAVRFKVFASPNHRSVHADHMPKMGGLAIYLAFSAGLLVHGWLSQDWHSARALLAGGTVAMLVGLLDDLYGLNCYVKLAGQTMAAAAAVFSGVVIHKVYMPLGFVWEPGLAAGPLTVLWIVAVMNAINLFDGLDGLAAGFTLIVGFFLIAAALIYGHIEAAVYMALLMAAAGGFIKHNFHPAEVFMGDTGSLFLGFTLATLALRAYQTPDAGINSAVLLVLFFVPLADTLLAIIRRLSRGQHPFTADRLHIHHRFLRIGLTQPQTVLALYGMALSCGMTSLILQVVHIYGALAILVVFLAISMVGLYLLGCFRFADDDCLGIEKNVEQKPVRP